MTSVEICALGIPVSSTAENILAIDSGLRWIAQNTTFVPKEGEELPSDVKMFLVKYVELINRDCTVTSESIAGMSQSFSTSGEIDSILRQYAKVLLGKWYKDGAKFIPAVRKWA